MLQDVERLDGLIDHLLDAARTFHRREAASDDVTELTPLLEQVRAGVVQRHGLTEDCVSIACEPGLKVQGREADVEIVFRNLIDNAVKYALPEPEVEVEAAPGKGRVVVRVADNGPGIPLARRHAVFRRFVRLGSELERSTPGTGIGLSLVRALVRQMRGTVTAKGRLTQRGSIFEVELPAGPPSA
jgi:two-component system, OmpR family, phosphate regulon sensor histidine kinase PhoR